MLQNSLIHKHSVNLSYWEIKEYFKLFDLIVVGSGIVGLNAAVSFKKSNPKASVLIIERGHLPNGASTKNAGFACFGSSGELLSDLKNMPDKTVWETVKMRAEGLSLLRKNLGDKTINYLNYGGYELFKSKTEFSYCYDNLKMLNEQIESYTGFKNTFTNSTEKIKKYGFSGISGMILNRHEGQINTDLMMRELLYLALKNKIQILNNITVKNIAEKGSDVDLESDFGVFRAKKVIVAVNGFAKKLLKRKDVIPARAQVLITEPIKNLKIKGAFHYNEGFYYFRNIDNRLLLGGGRNIDFKSETTHIIDTTKKIQSSLEHLLENTIYPKHKLKIEHRWAGIMGVGNEKKPIINHFSPNVICAIRMGGMGVAIGSIVGKKASDLAGS